MKYLIAGLGNPGSEYDNTRHNIGFRILDALCEDLKSTYKNERYAARSEARYAGRKLILIKPNTFMNLSGKAVRYWLEAEKLGNDRLLIVTDDISLPFGKIRLRSKGGDGGHNGLKDISQKLGTNKYARLRFGIGSEYSKGAQVDYVLSAFSESPEQIRERSLLASEAIKGFVRHGLSQTMTKYNAL